MSVEQDARAFGQHIKQGGWRLAFLVARSCDPTSKGGRPSQDENCSQENGSAKVSFRRFAEMAGVSASTVFYHYNAWQLAAEEGHCTPACQLMPDSEDGGRDDLEEVDEENRELWRKFYRMVRESNIGDTETKVAPKGRKSSEGRKRTTKADQQSHEASEGSASQTCEPGDPKAHPLYELLLAINELSDHLKPGHAASVADIVASAKRVATRRHRAALVRITGAM